MKKRFIACIVACAMLLMGTGYAYWADVITLNATVDTGNFDVRLKEASYISEFTDYSECWDTNSLTREAFKNTNAQVDAATPTIDDDDLNLTLTNMYPGYAQAYRFKADNYGTLAAKLANIEIVKNGWTSPMKDMIGMNLTATVKNQVYVYGWVEVLGWCWIPVNASGTAESSTGTPVVGDFAIDGVQFTQLTKLSEIAGFDHVTDGLPDDDLLYLDVHKTVNVEDYDDVAENLVTEGWLTGELNSEVIFNLSIGMNPDAAGAYTSGSTYITDPASWPADADSQNKSMVLNLVFNWDQYNTPNEE
jgi:hypothetical protein